MTLRLCPHHPAASEGIAGTAPRPRGAGDALLRRDAARCVPAALAHPSDGERGAAVGLPPHPQSVAPLFGRRRTQLLVDPFPLCEENRVRRCAAGLAVARRPAPLRQSLHLWFCFTGTSPWGPRLAAPVLCPLPPHPAQTGADPAGGWEPRVGCAAPKPSPGHVRVPLLAACRNPAALEDGGGGGGGFPAGVLALGRRVPRPCWRFRWCGATAAEWRAGKCMHAKISVKA